MSGKGERGGFRGRYRSSGSNTSRCRGRSISKGTIDRPTHATSTNLNDHSPSVRELERSPAQSERELQRAPAQSERGPITSDRPPLITSTEGSFDRSPSPFERAPGSAPSERASERPPRNSSLHSSDLRSAEGSLSASASASSGCGSTVSKLLIRPNGDEFFPPEAVKHITTVIKSKYEQPWLGWNEIPENVRNMWFIQFQNYCRWDPEHEDDIKRIWKLKTPSLVRSSLADIRRKKSKGKWLPASVLEALQTKWNTDPNFISMSEQNKKNISVNNDGCLNRGGAISISEHIRRLGIELGRDATVPEVFLRLNYDEETGEWRNSRAEGVYNKYKSLKATRLSEGVNEADIDDSTVFYEANGGKNKRGRSYGFGSEAAFYTDNSRSNARSKTTHPTNDEVQVLQSRLSAVESELASFRSLFAKLNNGSLTPSTSSIDVPPPCEGENVANVDEVVGNENEDDGDMGIGDDDDDDDGF